MKIILFAFTLLTSVAAMAQNTDTAQAQFDIKIKWTHSAQAGLNITQSSFSDNWKGGGISSISYGGFLNVLSKFQDIKWSVNSDLQLQLGFLNNGKQTTKNADRIFYDLKAGRKIAKHWDLFVSTNFQTQFQEGYLYGKKSDGGDSLVSLFMAPAYLTSSLGVEYKPVPYFWGRLGVGTLRQTFVLDDNLSAVKAYGLDKVGDKIRNQAVLQAIINFDKDLMNNVNLKFRSATNWDYIKFDRVGAIVQRFDINFTMKVNRYINTNIQAVVLYDYDQDKAWQRSQILSLGILYNWNR
jgi:hypothetical protein